MYNKHFGVRNKTNNKHCKSCNNAYTGIWNVQSKHNDCCTVRCHGEQLGQLWGSKLKTKPVEHLTTKCLILGFHLNLFYLLEKGHLSWAKLFQRASSFNVSCYIIHIIYYLCAMWGQMVMPRENLLLKAKSSMTEHGTWVGDHYMLGFAPTLWFLKSQILCRLYTSCG